MDFEIIECLGIISTNGNGWNRELNIVKTPNSAEPQYDIRGWSPDHKKYGNGITLSNEEAQIVAAMIANKVLNEESEEEGNMETTIIDFQTREKKTAEKIEFPF